MFLGQPVPVVASGNGYALFCEHCALGHNAPVLRVHDPKRMQIRVDGDPSRLSDASREEE